MLYNAIVIAGQFDRNMKVFQKMLSWQCKNRVSGQLFSQTFLHCSALVCYSLRILENWADSPCATQIADNVVISDY